MKAILKFLILLNMKITIHCLCGAKPLLVESIYFQRKKNKVIQDYFGTSAENGNRYSVWGWLRFAENPKKDIEILRYSMLKDFPEDQLMPMANRMLEMKYLSAKKSFQISIMDDQSNPIVKAGKLITEPGYWIFVGVSANYEDGIAHLFAKRYDTNKNISFVTGLNNPALNLKNSYQFSLGSFTEGSTKKSGLFGEMQHWYIGLFDFENVHLLWTTTYHDKFLKEHHYLNTYYIFDSYQRHIDAKSKSLSYSNLIGKFVNKVNYTFTQGIQVFPKGSVKIIGNLTIKNKFVKSMSVLIGLDLRKVVLTKKIVLYRRGPFKARLNGVFEVFATRNNVGEKWRLGVKYYYTEAGRKEVKKRIFISTLFFSGAYSTVQASVSVGPHNMVSIGMYLDGMVEFFEDQPYTVFKINQFEKYNHIFNSDTENWDYSTVYFFGIIETAGNLLFPLLNFRQNIAECSKGCSLTTDFIDGSFGCMECKLADNNVRDYNTLKCSKKCDIGYKALHRNCVHCDKDDCSDTDGPRITIRPLNQIKTHFLIGFNKKLAANNISWINNTKITIEPDFLSDEYDYDLKMIGKDKMSLWINSKMNRKNQNLTISLVDKSKVYDLEGNKLHIAIASYPLKYVDYYSLFEKQMVKFLSQLSNYSNFLTEIVIIIFLGTVALGFFINLFSYCLQMKPLTPRIVSLFHAFQYNMLLYFLNTKLPHNCSDFLERTYKGLVLMSKWVETLISSFCYMDDGYEESLSITTPEKFQEQGIRFAFLFNTSLPLFLQILIMVYYILIKLLNRIPIKHDLYQKFCRIQIRKLEYTAFIAAFLMFDLQLVVYSALNISLPVTTHYVYIVSLSASWIYFFILPLIAVCLLYFLKDKDWKLLKKPNLKIKEEDSEDEKKEEKDDNKNRKKEKKRARRKKRKRLKKRKKEEEKNKEYRQKYGILFAGFISKNPEDTMAYRSWYSIILARHFIFGCVLVFCYKNPLLQCSFCFFTTLGYLLLVYFCRPHSSKFHWVVECSNELMLTCNNFIYFILAWNEKYVFLKTSSRSYLGWIIIIIIIASISVKSIYVFFPIFYAFMKLFFGGAINQIKKGIKQIKLQSQKLKGGKKEEEEKKEEKEENDGKGRLETEERALNRDEEAGEEEMEGKIGGDEGQNKIEENEKEKAEDTGEGENKPPEEKIKDEVKLKADKDEGNNNGKVEVGEKFIELSKQDLADKIGNNSAVIDKKQDLEEHK